MMSEKIHVWKYDAYSLRGFDENENDKGRYIVLKDANGRAFMSPLLQDEREPIGRCRFNSLLAFGDALGVCYSSELIAALAVGLLQYEREQDKKGVFITVGDLWSLFVRVYWENEQKTGGGADE